jgi:hypothetical protein
MVGQMILSGILIAGDFLRPGAPHGARAPARRVRRAVTTFPSRWVETICPRPT